MCCENTSGSVETTAVMQGLWKQRMEEGDAFSLPEEDGAQRRDAGPNVDGRARREKEDATSSHPADTSRGNAAPVSPAATEGFLPLSPPLPRRLPGARHWTLPM
ncbi:uncharacterized protein [Dermacentor albipictus]|uniref:uncharacterized protein isoform X3 n=1 Tax=Dermacentor albipictus TaxID=60249 RepID=UPI0038FC501F